MTHDDRKQPSGAQLAGNETQTRLRIAALRALGGDLGRWCRRRAGRDTPPVLRPGGSRPWLIRPVSSSRMARGVQRLANTFCGTGSGSGSSDASSRSGRGTDREQSRRVLHEIFME